MLWFFHSIHTSRSLVPPNAAASSAVSTQPSAVWELWPLPIRKQESTGGMGPLLASEINVTAVAYDVYNYIRLQTLEPLAGSCPGFWLLGLAELI